MLKEGWFVCLVVGVDLAELDLVVEGLGLSAGNGVDLVVASESALIEDGSVAADEGPLSGLDDGTEVILEGEADVEELAGVGDVGVVAVFASLAGEGQAQRLIEKGLGGVGQEVRLVAGGPLGDGSDEGGESDGGQDFSDHFEGFFWGRLRVKDSKDF